MKLTKAAVLSVAVVLAGALASAPAEARPGGGRGHVRGHGHGHVHHGSRAFLYAAPIFVGAVIASRYYYPTPVYYAPPPPPVYIEQPVPDPAAQAYWYYCPQSRAYYPQVQSCACGWQRVAPQPPPN